MSKRQRIEELEQKKRLIRSTKTDLPEKTVQQFNTIRSKIRTKAEARAMRKRVAYHYANDIHHEEEGKKEDQNIQKLLQEYARGYNKGR